MKLGPSNNGNAGSIPAQGVNVDAIFSLYSVTAEV